MNPNIFATVSLRIVGIVVLVVGLVCVGSSAVVRALSTDLAGELANPDTRLHDQYFVVKQFEDPWLLPGLVSILVGVVLLLASRRLGALVTKQTAPEN